MSENIGRIPINFYIGGLYSENAVSIFMSILMETLNFMKLKEDKRFYSKQLLF
jgi:hypothetical protein